jgi:diguanylate cyclase (GGDEF)-like protein
MSDADEPRHHGVLPMAHALSRRITIGLGPAALRRPGFEVIYGRWLLVITGVVVSVPMPLLDLSTRQVLVVGQLTAAMCGVLLLSLLLPWDRMPNHAVLAFPISVLAALACLGRFAGPDIGSCYTGLFVLCFAYVGVCCRPRTIAWVLPLSLPAYVATVNDWNANIGIRLVIAASVWTLLAELLAHLTAQQRLIMATLEQASLTDSLTQLANRRDFDVRLAGLAPGDTVVICDLDHFKAVNDTFGHAQGDIVLRDFGRVLRGALRGDDYAARYGGEEFVLFLADTDEAQTRDVLDRLHRRWGRVQPQITFSAGFATRDAARTAAEVVEAADQALYLAKESGRNQDRDIREILRTSTLR